MPLWLLGAWNWLAPARALIANALRDPWVIAVLCALVAIATWRIEESRVAAANARTDHVAQTWRSAFDQERNSFRTVDNALKLQNAAVATLGAAGRRETAVATSSWSSDAKALAAAQSGASSRPAPDPKGNAADEADTIFRASREELQ